MKYIIIVLTLFCFSCGNKNAELKNPIVGIWEMTQLKVAINGKIPLMPITNKKDIYTEDGIYHDTDATSTKITDSSLRKYKIKGNKIELYEDGRLIRSSQFTMPNNNTLVLIVDKKGSQLFFKRLSSKATPIPAIKKKYAKVILNENDIRNQKTK